MASAPASFAAWTMRTAASYCWPWLADSSAMTYVGWPAPIWRPAIANGAVMGWSPRGGRGARGGRGGQGRREGGEVVDGEVGIGGGGDPDGVPAALVRQAPGADRGEAGRAGADEVLPRVVTDIGGLRGLDPEDEARDAKADGRRLSQSGAQLVGQHDEVEALGEAGDGVELAALDAGGAVRDEAGPETRGARGIDRLECTREGLRRAVSCPVRKHARRQEVRIVADPVLGEERVEEPASALLVVELPEARGQGRGVGANPRPQEIRDRAEAAVDELVLGVQGVVEVEQDRAQRSREGRGHAVTRSASRTNRSS